jgi:hypothetical protein
LVKGKENIEKTAENIVRLMNLLWLIKYKYNIKSAFYFKTHF